MLRYVTGMEKLTDKPDKNRRFKSKKIYEKIYKHFTFYKPK